MNVFLTLIRRELWEHRSLVWAPLITAALLVLTTFFGSRVGGIDIDLDSDSSVFFADLGQNPGAQIQLFSVWISSLLIPQLLVALIVVFFYLIDSLYAERKDRSILFWKSLPVSDTATVGAKFAVATVLMPIWVWAISLVSGLLIFIIIKAIVSGTPLAPLGMWDGSAWLLVQATLLQNLFIATLWYAPIAAWLLLVSVFAKRNPFLWAVLPPLLLLVLEAVAFESQYVLNFLGHRLGGFFEAMQPALLRTDRAETSIQSISEAYAALSAAPLLSTPSLWLGVAAAGLLLVLVIRLRRWRDEA